MSSMCLFIVLAEARDNEERGFLVDFEKKHFDEVSGCRIVQCGVQTKDSPAVVLLSFSLFMANAMEKIAESFASEFHYIVVH